MEPSNNQSSEENEVEDDSDILDEQEDYDDNEQFTPIFLENNSNVINDMINVQLLLSMMTGSMMTNNSLFASPQPTIIAQINPSNSGNSVLPATTLTGQVVNTPGEALNTPGNNNIGTQELIEEEVTKLIIAGNDNMHLVTQPILDFIENCYLENMQYDDDVTNLIRYTIRSAIIRGINYELKEIIAGVMYYSLMGLNINFSDNYDLLVLPMLQNELKRIVTQSIRLSILRRAIMPQQMEDVKLVVKKEILDNILTSKYSELEEKIKLMNSKCTVCQDDFNSEDKVRVLKCEHVYHLDCIDDWLKEYSYKCPCCREPAAEYSAKI